MILLQNNKLVTIDTSEDTSVVMAYRTIEEIGSSLAAKAEILKLIMHDSASPNYGKYNWKVIQSHYSDDSSLGDYYMTFITKGLAISRMLEVGYHVTINGKEVTREDL